MHSATKNIVYHPTYIYWASTHHIGTPKDKQDP